VSFSISHLTKALTSTAQTCCACESGTGRVRNGKRAYTKNGNFIKGNVWRVQHCNTCHRTYERNINSGALIAIQPIKSNNQISN
jgi:hypothetical protein